MDWINCNACFIQPGNGRKFHLTSCGHIYCDGCVYERTKDNCYMCNQKCSSFQLSNQMSPDIDVYFYDFCEIIKQYRKQFIESIDQRLLKLDKIYSFQNSHRLHLQKHLLFSISKQNELNQRITLLTDKNKQLEEENNYLKNSIATMKANQANYEGYSKKFNFNDDPLRIPKSGIDNRSNNLTGFRENFDTPISRLVDMKPSFPNTEIHSSTNTNTGLNNNLNSLFNSSTISSNMGGNNSTKSNHENRYHTPDNILHNPNSLNNNNNKAYLKNISTQSIRDIILSLSQNKTN